MKKQYTRTFQSGPSQEQNSELYSFLSSENCNDLYTRKILQGRLNQHRRANPSGHRSPEHLHLKDSG